ncbi:unnamed protein product [[Actinomadura] parvosata subsp. kistnae]|nr:unnamed protein product [Actinomadura parvosata subsp. kistnae]
MPAGDVGGTVHWGLFLHQALSLGHVLANIRRFRAAVNGPLANGAEAGVGGPSGSRGPPRGPRCFCGVTRVLAVTSSLSRVRPATGCGDPRPLDPVR